ncbi:hypothetical protein FRC19_009361 [Serendipita sp. 401]|nr:hypothetical protein FRC19_009361 [Serendipita sp. 401]
MKFFITSVTVLVLYVASSVVAAPLPAPAIAAYDGNMMKRDLSRVVDLERRHHSYGHFCRRSPDHHPWWCMHPSHAKGAGQGSNEELPNNVPVNPASSEPNAASASSPTDPSPVPQ